MAEAYFPARRHGRCGAEGLPKERWRAPHSASPWVAVALCLILSVANAGASASSEISIFPGNQIHSLPDAPGKYDTGKVRASEAGRVLSTEVDLPEITGPARITLRLTVDPIPKDDESVYDHWDRAGNIRLAVPGGPDLEVLKFITAYGGRTEYEADVSVLAPLLRGRRTFHAFIDTWVSPAWKIDCRLVVCPDSTASNPAWVQSLLYEEAYTAADPGEGGRTAEVEVPEGIRRVILYYLVSGHCTDGKDADEFVRKDNVLMVDGHAVYRYRPWRDDCRRFREINPYCRRWSDGSWSSDYSRSGWCPGDQVRPLELDLSDHLTAGKHTLRFLVEKVRPRDEQGQFGYWRISSYLAGWKD